MKRNVKNILMHSRLQRVSLYREIFEKYYPGQAEMIAGFWMPNQEWEGCDVTDPSARVLANYGASGE